MSAIHHKKRLSFQERASLTQHPVAKKIFSLMEEKQTNVCVAADVTKADDLLLLAKEVGSEICVFKTHIDILEDFTPSVTSELSKIANDLGFLIFEDRKFADIGSTVAMQYTKSLYKIASWAHIINAHILPGPGVIEGLQQEEILQDRALLLIAQMSSKGNFMTSEYTNQVVQLAIEYQDFVIGFISQQQVSEHPHFLHFTPGVQFCENRDHLKQSYRSPTKAIQEELNDIIIVGRGILHSSNRSETAKKYKKISWDKYLNLIHYADVK